MNNEKLRLTRTGKFAKQYNALARAQERANNPEFKKMWACKRRELMIKSEVINDTVH